MTAQLKIDPADLVNMAAAPVRIDLAYAQEDNLLLGERIYRKDAALWLYRDLAQIVKQAAEEARAKGLRLVLYDGLRTTDAQQKMLGTARVQANRHWLEPPRLLSPPGTGAHPRGMAIDLTLETADGALLDMGTPFDFLAGNPAPEHNPAHRASIHISREAANNRAILDDLMQNAARDLKREIYPLPQEWWDYRLPNSFYERYAPLCDADLPPDMRMVQGT